MLIVLTDNGNKQSLHQFSYHRRGCSLSASTLSRYLREFFLCYTLDYEVGNVGWISNPQSSDDAQWWADLLQRKFLLVVQAYVVGEAYLEGSHSEAAITKDLQTYSPFLTADNIRFPPVKAGSDIDLQYLGRNPFPVLNASDGVSVMPTSRRTMTFTDLANEGIHPVEDIPERAEIIPELLQDLDSRARQKEDEEREELLRARAEDRMIEAEEGVAPITPQPPIEVESSILQPPLEYSAPPDYVYDLAYHYARANIWGKTAIHLQLLEQEKRRLDTLNFQIHSRIEKMEEEEAEVRQQIALTRQKHQVLRDLYEKHMEKLASLENEKAVLQMEVEQKQHEGSHQPTRVACSRKRTASVAGRTSGGRSKSQISQDVVGLGRLKNSIAHGKQNAPALRPNPYPADPDTVKDTARVCN